MTKANIQISIYHDTRRAKQDGTYPVKLRVYDPVKKKTKFYPTKFDLSKEDFHLAWELVKVRREFKQINRELKALEYHAQEVHSKTTPFTFEKFENKLFERSGSENKVFIQFEAMILELKDSGRMGTASSYQDAMNSFLDYVAPRAKGEGREVQKKSKKVLNFSFEDITSKFLFDYEAYMTEEQGKSITSVGIYTRALRTLYNKVKETEEQLQALYPFTKSGYIPPSGKGTKRALNAEQLKTLFQAEPRTIYQEKAKDFWFFSFFCSGINLKDIAYLRNENLTEEGFRFIREKTKRSTRAKQKELSIYFNDYSKAILEKYRTKGGAKDLVFDIVDSSASKEVKHNQTKNFIRTLNQHLKVLAKENGLPEDISFYWARHTFATTSIRKGASFEFVGEALGHNSTQTTRKYFAGFEEDSKKEFANSLLDF